MFRCAIRRRDFDGQATFYVLCDTNMHCQLIELAKERYGKLDVKVIVDAQTPAEVQRSKREMRKAKDPVKGTANQRFMAWHSMCPPGRSLTTRQLQQEANLSANDLKNLSKRYSNGEYYDPVAGPRLAVMHIGRNRYMKPVDETGEAATD